MWRLPVCLLLAAPAISAKKTNMMDYCAQHPRNTPCMFDCQRSSRCGHTDTSYQTLSDDLRNFVVTYHNEKRAFLASGGLALQKPQQPHYNPVSYDKECEFIAGCYAKQCRNHPDKVRIALDSAWLGQNRYVLSMKRGSHHSQVREQAHFRQQVLRGAIDSWFNPGALLTDRYYPAIHEAYAPIIYPQRCATFTQLVWERTQYVGCAFMHSVRDSKWDMYEVLCNYKPQGNVLGEKVYALRNDDPGCEPQASYHGMAMCAEKFRTLQDDPYEAPFSLDAAARGARGRSVLAHFLAVLGVRLL